MTPAKAAITLAVILIYVCLSAFGLYKIKLSGMAWSADFFIGFCCYGFGFLIWLYILKSNPLSWAFPIAAGMLMVATQVVGYFWLREKIGWWHIAGFCLILAGVVLMNMNPHWDRAH